MNFKGNKKVLGGRMLEKINELLKPLIFNPSEVKIYRILLEKGEMTVSEIAAELKLSTRIVRIRLQKLLKEGLIRRRIVERGWIGYAYTAEKPEKVVGIIKNRLRGYHLFY